MTTKYISARHYAALADAINQHLQVIVTYAGLIAEETVEPHASRARKIEARGLKIGEMLREFGRKL